MHFLYNGWNHSKLGQLSLQDVISIIARQLEALGHTVQWCNDGLYTHPATCNILFEGFDDAYIECMRQCKASGGKIIIIATEEPTESGFNHGILPDMIRRQNKFPEAAQYADAIWHLVPGCGDWYRQFCDKVSFLELGYSPGMIRRPKAPLDHDFGFFGSITPRRQRILNRLHAMGKSVRWTQFDTCVQRDIEMSRCRVILQIRAHEGMGLMSNSRCNTALHLGRPVIAEPHAIPGDAWRKIIEFSTTEELFFSRAIAMRRNWKAIFDRQFSAFKSLLTPDECVGKALSATFDAETLSRSLPKIAA